MFYNLHMRAASGDLTAAATIRDTAMRLFAERGAADVTVREIAAAAGVSPSLVIHHYGSKDALRAAVDRRVIGLVDALVTELTDSSGGGAPTASLAAALADHLERDPLLPAYVRRLLIDGGEHAQQLFRSLYDALLSGFASLEAAGIVRPTTDAPVRAAFLLVNDLAVVLMREHVRWVLGIDPLTRSGGERWTTQVLDVYTHGIFALDGAPAISDDARGSTS